MASSALATVGLGGMAQRGLDDERVLMDERRVVVLSGGVDGLPMGLNTIWRSLSIKLNKC